MPAEASNDESQALQLRKAIEVLANMSVIVREILLRVASQDSQLIKPGQRVLDNEGSQSQDSSGTHGTRALKNYSHGER